jgi:CII-binding regulator of phage lambda lysogenization HflD
MGDDERDALLTPLGREEMLRRHGELLQELDERLTDVERKEAGRDKRWDLVVKALVSIGVGIIVALSTALITLGIHP